MLNFYKNNPIASFIRQHKKFFNVFQVFYFLIGLISWCILAPLEYFYRDVLEFSIYYLFAYLITFVLLVEYTSIIIED